MGKVSIDRQCKRFGSTDDSFLYRGDLIHLTFPIVEMSSWQISAKPRRRARWGSIRQTELIGGDEGPGTRRFSDT